MYIQTELSAIPTCVISTVAIIVGEILSFWSVEYLHYNYCFVCTYINRPVIIVSNIVRSVCVSRVCVRLSVRTDTSTIVIRNS